mgnify:CR=1 FL=1|jgi:spore maturation protein SpmA
MCRGTANQEQEAFIFGGGFKEYWLPIVVGLLGVTAFWLGGGTVATATTVTAVLSLGILGALREIVDWL